MTFVLLSSKVGKDLILFNEHKYRESRALKNGDVVWQCLGKGCKATLKTDKEKSAIYYANEEHTGSHPLTMRTTTTPKQSKRLRPATPTSVASTPTTDNPSTSMSCTPGTSVIIDPVTSPARNGTTSTPASTSVLDSLALHISPLEISDLRAENAALRMELADLREKMRVVLNHSIESDQRLLQFTDEVFLHPPSSSEAVRPLNVVDCATQCEPLTTCSDYRCSATRDLVDSLRTTISVLEAEVQTWRDGASQYHRQCNETANGVKSGEMRLEDDVNNICDDVDFVTVSNRRKRNRGRNSNNNTDNNLHHPTAIKPLPYAKSKSTYNKNTPFQKQIPFKNISILGDSHVRNLAGVVQGKVRDDILVTGVCKPGAGLLSVMTTSASFKDHCYVLMAGSNDVDSGREAVIFSQLEKILFSCEETSSVLLVPLPTRYDLPPDSPIHRMVGRVNRYMAELCNRHEAVELLDIRSIGRRHFTRHGMHLGKSGKRLLASLIVQRLSEMVVGAHPDGGRNVTAEHFPSHEESHSAHQSYAAAAAGINSSKEHLENRVTLDCTYKNSFLGIRDLI